MLIKRLREKKIVIFGTGHVAHKFYKIVKDKGLKNQIICFTRTANVNDGEVIDGIPVYCFENIRINDDTLVCIAVHEAIKSEIEKTVRQRTGRYLWIYPYLYSFMFGESEQKNVELEVRELLKKYRSDLRLGVRLAAIEQEEGLNTYGFGYYVRAQMTYCGKETAEQRLKQFLGLIRSWKQSGYNKKYLMSLNRNYEVIDGNHRLSMAVYMGQKVIYGDIYPTDLPIEEIHGEEPMQTKELLLRNGFTADEIAILEKIQERYLKEYERV